MFKTDAINQTMPQTPTPSSITRRSSPGIRTGLACLAMGVVLGLGVAMPFIIAGAGRSPDAGLAAANAEPSVEAGGYLVQIAGCNDCHTPGFAQTGGKIPESMWLTGSSVGFKGPWGTSYPANLRVKAQTLTEDQWTTFAKNYDGRPPMPWFALHAMTERDLRSVYRYIRSLGPSDVKVPAAVPPDQTPLTPYVVFEPVMPGTK